MNSPEKSNVALEKPDKKRVERYLRTLQDRICESLSAVDGHSFQEEQWQHATGQGGGRTRVLQHPESLAADSVFEKAGVNFSHVMGAELPPAATKKRPELAGKPFEAMGVSLVLHPHNPHVPTAHMNVRFFMAGGDTLQPIWWFGGGFDMTPYYGYQADAEHWHRTAQQACAVEGEGAYQRYKKWCDDYFHLRHRNEQRGIGGLFFDDLNQPDFAHSFAVMQSVGDHFLPAYSPIVERRRHTQYTPQQRDWQLYRRGRYVEFNLVWDRGTLFGLQSGGRTESILMSLPPLVKWHYAFQAQKGSAEDRLVQDFLSPKDWLNGDSVNNDGC